MLFCSLNHLVVGQSLNSISLRHSLKGHAGPITLLSDAVAGLLCNRDALAHRRRQEEHVKSMVEATTTLNQVCVTLGESLGTSIVGSKKSLCLLQPVAGSEKNTAYIMQSVVGSEKIVSYIAVSCLLR